MTTTTDLTAAAVELTFEEVVRLDESLGTLHEINLRVIKALGSAATTPEAQDLLERTIEKNAAILELRAKLYEAVKS